MASSAYAHDVKLGLEAIAAAMCDTARGEPDYARLRLALSFAPPASEGGSAQAATNEAIFGAVEAFFRAAADDHGNMRGRSKPYAAAFIGTIDTYVGLFLAGRSELSPAVVTGAVRQFMHGIFS
jgi:TetR/AcrR family transcriptional regulator